MIVVIDFTTPSEKIITNAVVTAMDYFCDAFQVFVSYQVTDYNGNALAMTGWVSLREVLNYKIVNLLN